MTKQPTPQLPPRTPICTSCGDRPKQGASGFRFFIRGLTHCDPCFNRKTGGQGAKVDGR